MSDMEPRTVTITRAQALAAQLIEKLDRESGATTDPNVSRVAAAGRNAGVSLRRGQGNSATQLRRAASAVPRATPDR